MNLGQHNKEIPEVEEKTQEEKKYERELILERITQIYDEPIVSKSGEARKEIAIQNLYARKRGLEVDSPLILS